MTNLAYAGRICSVHRSDLWHDVEVSSTAYRPVVADGQKVSELVSDLRQHHPKGIRALVTVREGLWHVAEVGGKLLDPPLGKLGELWNELRRQQR